MHEVKLQGFKMILQGDNYLEEKIIKTGSWEPTTTEVFRDLLEPGMTVVDIGANIGYFSLLSASLVGHTGQVHAFEPYPGYQERLKHSLSANDMPQIRLIPLALSDKVETHELYKGLASARMHQWTHDNPVFNEIHDVVKVHCIPFDEYAKQHLDRIDVIKIDVDGYEMNVLRGGRQSLRKHRPVVIIELFEEALVDAGTSVRELLELFKELNYVPFSEQGQELDYDDLHSDATRDPKISVNVVFRPCPRPTVKNQTQADRTHKLKAGLVIDLPFHEANKWVSATTWHLIEGIREVFDCLPIQSQTDYESVVDQLDCLISMEPGWAAPKLDLTRTDDLRRKIERIPSYILYSDPHANKWRQDYFLDNAFDYILSYYWHPIVYHFDKIHSSQIIHFPWAIPDQWIGDESIRCRQQKKIHCFGGKNSPAYALRNWCREFDFVKSTSNSGCENKVLTETGYIQWLRGKDACVAAGSDDIKYRLTVPKYFEIAASGSLLFAQETEDLKLLGFENETNCIIFNRENFERLSRNYLENPEAYLQIRRNGRELIRSRHSLSARVQELKNHVSAGLRQKADKQVLSGTISPDNERPENLTNVEYWDQDRKNDFKPWQVNSIPFASVLDEHLPVNQNFSCVELGAYPGGKLCYLAKRFKYYPVAIEFSKHCNHIEKLFQYNGINQFKIFNQDVFSPVNMKFDVVTSFGFIEHFENYEEVIDRHFQILKPGGYVVISCPYLDNYQGMLRELVYTDEKLQTVLSTHNRKIMNLDELKRVFSKYDVELCFADFVMGNKVWLDSESDYIKPQMRWLVKYLGAINSAAGEDLPSSPLYSPMILIVARDKTAAGNKRLKAPIRIDDTTKQNPPVCHQIRTKDIARKATKKILFIVDKPGWAHDFKTENLKRCLDKEYQIEKRYNENLTANDIETADLVVIYYWKQIRHKNLQKLIPVLQKNRSKILIGICSHGELKGQWKERGLSVLRQFASGIFVNSKLLFDEFSSYFDVPVFYTPNGVDTEFFQFIKKQSSQKKLVVGWAGSLSNHGDIRGYDDYIVPAVDKAEGVELLTAARETKWRNPEQMRQFYQDIDVYICASSEEGTPNPCLEAAACGVPILTTAVGNMPELIRHGVNGYFIERDVESIASKLKLLNDQKDLLGELGKGIQESIQEWDWKHQSKNYRMMFESMLAGTGSQDNLFKSRGQVYIASADRMDQVLSNVNALREMPSEQVDHYVSVVGGLSGLNYLLSINPKEITFFDLNPFALEYAKLVLELISVSADHRDFISRVFARSVGAFLAHHKQAELTLQNQHMYLSMPVEQEIINGTLSKLSENGRCLYKTYLMPYLLGNTLEGTRNCCCLLPCFGIHERVPVGGGKDKGYNENGQLVPNINTFFYGQGWLASKDTFLRVKEIICHRNIRYIPFNLLDGELDILADFSGRVVIHASNIDDWFKDGWSRWINTVSDRSVRSQGSLHVITTNGGVMTPNVDAHAKAYAAIEPYVYGKVTEVTHKVPWGFHEFERENVLYSDYLKGSYPADTTILHILVGEGLSVDELGAVYRRALQQSKRVLVMEHNKNSLDWTTDKAAKMLSVDESYSLLQKIACDYDAVVSVVQKIAGQCDLERNILFVIECRKTHFLKRGLRLASAALAQEKDNKGQNMVRPLSIEPIDIFRQAREQFNLGNMVTAQRLITQYRKTMDYKGIDVRRNISWDKPPMFSIVLITYNRPKDVAQCVQTLQKQHCRDFEIVLVDNGDKDKKARSLANNVDLYVDCPINFCLSEGRNIGAQFANGQILVMLDDDALVGPEYLDSIRGAFEQHEILGLRGRAFPKNGLKPDKRIGVYDLGEQPLVTMCNQEGNSAFRRDAYLTIGGMDPLLFGHEGTDLTYRLMQRYNHSSAIIYWPQTVIYHDYGDQDKYDQKHKRYERNRDYLKYKHDVDIVGMKDEIAKNALKVNKSGRLLPSLASLQPSPISKQPQATGRTDSPKVSVVMACHNAADFLSQTLGTILNQSLKDWELLVVDDASTDQTRAILKSYADQDTRIRLWFFDDPQGPYVRRNFAIKQAKAPFICIHDSDDLMAPHKLSILYEAIGQDDRLGIVGSHYRRFYDIFRGEEYGDRMEKRITHKELMETFPTTWHLCWHGSAIIRKSLFEMIGPYDKQPYGSDTFWLSKAGLFGLLTGKVIFKNLPEYLTYKREHAQSQTGKISPVDPRNRRHRLERYYIQKLQAIVSDAKSNSLLNVVEAIKNSTCSDFIPKYGHLFDQWESAPISKEMIQDVLNRAICQFTEENYVSCLITLNGLEQMLSGDGQSYRNLYLTKGLACYACGDDQKAIENIQMDIQLFRNSNSRVFLERYLSGEKTVTTVADRRLIIRQFIAEMSENKPAYTVCDQPREQTAEPSSVLHRKLAIAKQFLYCGKTKEALAMYQELLSDKTVSQHIVLKDKIQKLVEGIHTERVFQMSPISGNHVVSNEKSLYI